MATKIHSTEKDRLLGDDDSNLAQFILPKNCQEEGVISQIEMYDQPGWKTFIYYVLCVLTVGIWWLLIRWELGLRKATLMTRSNLAKAKHLIITSEEKEVEHVEIQQRDQEKFFWYRLYKYILNNDGVWIPIESPFLKVNGLKVLSECGLTTSDYGAKFQYFGSNQTAIPEKSTLKILIDEILSPFYMFQVFSVTLWMLEPYYVYSGVIFFTSVVSVIVTLQETKQNHARLREMSTLRGQVVVYRNVKQFLIVADGELRVEKEIAGEGQNVPSEQLVPGDLIQITDGQIIPCDCVVVSGTAVANESMLTGESIPVIKTPLQAKMTYDPNGEAKQSTLFAGTKCIEARKSKIQGHQTPVLAMVTQTGFSTMKGQLVRSILFPKPTKFSFNSDALKFVGVLAIMAVLGTLITLKDQINAVQEGDSTNSQMVMDMLDLVTITVPPALPTCLAIGISMALGRLQKKKVFCISPNRINVAGKITIMCFDKTGTLTEEGLDLYGIRTIAKRKKEVKFHDLQMEFNKIPNDFEEIMAACHGLTVVGGQTLGEELELKMFEATKWKLVEEEKTIVSTPDKSLIIQKRFEFSSTLQRMSVIVEDNDGRLRAFVKGSPEKLRELCVQSSLPKNFHKILDYYAKSGFRVLACASRDLDRVYLERNDVEYDLRFEGLLIMQNKLKVQTPAAIDKLQDANIRTVMVTGDNVLTAISVARACHIVHPDQRIFLGDIDENNPDRVVWKDFDMSDNALDPITLSPEKSILVGSVPVHEDDLPEESASGTQTGPNGPSPWMGPESSPPTIKSTAVEKKLAIEIQHAEQSDHIAAQASSLRASRKSIREIEQDAIASQIDHLVDDIVPWQNFDEVFTLAISGKAFYHLQRKADSGDPAARKVFGIMLERAQVFARMRPEDKASLVAFLQGINRKALVGMCGDGANDCAALKTADVGISLSEAEASIAAPFTSKIQDISCVIKVLREGRAALVTSFQCFKYMALYSMIQFASVTLLYQVNSNLSDWQFLYADLLIIIPLAATMGQTKSFKQLSPYQPGANLISFPVLMSVIGQTLVSIVFQCVVYFVLLKQSWYRSVIDIHRDIGNADDDIEMSKGFEDTSLFWFANFQYISTCLVFSIGKPFRRPFYTNYLFTGFIIFMYFLNTYVIFFSHYPKDWIYNLLFLFDSYTSETDPSLTTSMPQSWKWFIFGLAIGNSIVSYLFEKYAILYVTRAYRAKKRQILKRYREPENPYLRALE